VFKGVKLAQQINGLQAKILRELLADGRKSDSEIAEEIGVPKKIVKRNYIEMQKVGIIRGATTHINYRLFGFKAVAHIIIRIAPEQETQLIAYLQKIPEVYAYRSRGIKGQVDVTLILRTLHQLNGIKDELKRTFTVLEMKSAIWTDVKEMNYNLSIIDEARNLKITSQLPKKLTTETTKIVIDTTDQKIADILAEDGRITMTALAKEVGVSANIAKKRYEKLRENGYLKITIQVDPQKIGYHALCIFFTSISSENLSGIIEQVSEIPDIISIMKTSGDFDLQIYAMVQNLEQFLSIKKQIGHIGGISKMELEIDQFSERMTKWPSPRQYISTF
jgi:Lrp/AsnC family transcriptional regulator, leucine-responsive regulatory protein